MCWVFGAVIVFLYLVPLFKILVKLLRKAVFLDRFLVYGKMPKAVRHFAQAISVFEYYLHPFRRLFCTPVLWGFFGYQLYQLYFDREFSREIVLLILANGLLLVLNHWVNSEKHRVNVRMMEYLRVRPGLDPEEFFDRYRRQLALAFGGLGNDFENKIILPEDADFRKHERSRFKRFLVFKALWDTIQCADILLSVLDRVGPQYLYENADKIASMAGKRILQLCQGALTVRGLEKLNGLKGKFILVANHESSLDFMLTFFALSTVTVNNRGVRPRFLVAKDHFKDNPFVYHLMGIGKVVEAMDMIFLNRKNRKKSHENLKEAAKAIVTKDVDLAIYPQGTRAPCTYDRTGKRRGAGYYTTLHKKHPHRSDAHLKKGTAHLALDILLELHERGLNEDLHLVFLGIEGASVILPKSQWKVETEVPVEFTVGDVLKLPTSMVAEIFPEGLDSEHNTVYRRKFINHLNTVIDDKLKDTLHVHQRLAKRFLMDLRGQFRHLDKEKIDIIESNLKLAHENDARVFQILDRIYTLPTKEWNGYLSQLCQLMLGHVESKRLESLLHAITEKLLEYKI